MYSPTHIHLLEEICTTDDDVSSTQEMTDMTDCNGSDAGKEMVKSVDNRKKIVARRRTRGKITDYFVST